MTEERKRKKQSFNVLSTLRNFDIFGEDVDFLISGKRSVTSFAGAMMTIFVTVVSLVYAWTRFEVMLNYADTRFQVTEDYREDLS